MRTLEEIANSTPLDYLTHAPKDPVALAHKMLQVARQKLPKEADGDPNYRFMFVGPGAGLVVKELILLEQQARGVETSKRGITYAPQDVWAYVGWKKPWELTQGDKGIDVCLVNRYLQTLLLPDEWSRTVAEIKRISKYSSLI
jgi:hypothetical protein